MAIHIRRLFREVFGWIRAETALNNAPRAAPDAPSSGDYEIVGTAGSGAHTGHNKAIARWGGAAYTYSGPVAGQRVYVQHNRAVYGYDDTTWQPLLYIGDEPYQALTVASHAATYNARTSVNATVAHPAAALAIDWLVETLWNGAHGTMLITNHASDVSDLPTFTLDEATSSVVLIAAAAYAADFDTASGKRSWWSWTYDGSKLWIRYDGGQD